MEKQKLIIGGQAVMEGVMMKGPDRIAVAVRTPDGKLNLKTKEVRSAGDAHAFFKLPVVRGVVNFVSMLKMGIETLGISMDLLGLEEEEPSRLEKSLAKATGKSASDITMAIALVIAVVFSVGLFFVLPSLIVSLLTGFLKTKLAVGLVEGAVRIVLFLCYLSAISFMPEIKRMFRYHGAEHKTVYCYEADKELTPENCRAFSTLHPRCGTSFLLIVMVISILFFSAFGWNLNAFTRVLSRLALLPLVAGVSYEALKLLARFDNPFTRALRWPGLMLQKITTKEPDDGMLEVAIAAMKAALPEGDPLKGAAMDEAS